MFYTKLGRVAAAIAFVLGLIWIAFGVAVLTGAIEPEPGYYLEDNAISEWMDRGIYYVMFGIVLGVITDISNSVAKGN